MIIWSAFDCPGAALPAHWCGIFLRPSLQMWKHDSLTEWIVRIAIKPQNKKLSWDQKVIALPTATEEASQSPWLRQHVHVQSTVSHRNAVAGGVGGCREPLGRWRTCHARAISTHPSASFPQTPWLRVITITTCVLCPWGNNYERWLPVKLFDSVLLPSARAPGAVWKLRRLWRPNAVRVVV